MAGQVGAAVFTLLQGLLLARALGVERYGVWVLVTTVTLAVVQLFDFRVWETVIRFVPHYQSRQDNRKATATVQLCYLIDTVTGLAAWVFLVAGSQLASRFFLKEHSDSVLLITFAVAAILSIPFETSSALLRIGNRFHWLAIHRVAVAAVRLGATAFVWAHEPTVLSMLLAHLLGTAIGIPIILVSAIRTCRAMSLPFWRRPLITPLRGDLRRVLRYSFLTSLTGTSRIVTDKADNLLLGLLAGPAVVGGYDLAKKIVTQLATFSNAFYTAIFPEVSQLVARREFGKLRVLQRRSSVWLLAAVIPSSLVLALTAPWFIPLFFGADYSASVGIFQILVWRFLWLPLIWFPGFMLALGKEVVVTTLAWLYAGVFLLALFTLIPQLGAIGAAVADLASQLFWCLAAVWTLRRVQRSGWESPAPGA
jgi:O-antigen/teichoic acid export membrane protein